MQPWVNTRGCTAVWCRIRSDLYVQIKVVLNRGFEFLLLDTDVALGDCSAAVLQELLDQGHVTAVLYRFWEKHHFSTSISCLFFLLDGYFVSVYNSQQWKETLKLLDFMDGTGLHRK